MEIYWLEQTEGDVPIGDDWLSESELSRLDSLRFPKRRADWRLGRWTAKRAMAAALSLPDDNRALANIIVTAAATGEPEVTFAGGGPAVTISISHRDGRASCAIARGTVALGCDLELVEPKSDGFIADYFTPEEQELVARTNAAARPLLASLLWSAKESALKALHVGLRADTRSVIVDPSELYGAEMPGIDWHPLRIHCAETLNFHGWWHCSEGFLRTVVATPAPLRPIDLSPLIRAEAKPLAS